MTTEYKPIVPVSDEQRERLRQFKGFVILGNLPGENHVSGFVEHSFSMGWDRSHVNMWVWHPEWGYFKTEDPVRDNCQKYADKYKEQNAKVWDIHDPDLPIVLDIEAWIDAQAYNPNTLSGVSDKFKARNAPFKMKDEL